LDSDDQKKASLVVASNTPDEQEVKSPCIGRCCLDYDDICVGCFRSIDEITSWRQASQDERRQYLNNAKARAQNARRD